MRSLIIYTKFKTFLKEKLKDQFNYVLYKNTKQKIKKISSYEDLKPFIRASITLLRTNIEYKYIYLLYYEFYYLYLNRSNYYNLDERIMYILNISINNDNYKIIPIYNKFNVILQFLQFYPFLQNYKIFYIYLNNKRFEKDYIILELLFFYNKINDFYNKIMHSSTCSCSFHCDYYIDDDLKINITKLYKSYNRHCWMVAVIRGIIKKTNELK